MREFCKPWRRKLGSLGLLMACLFMAGWVRSFNRGDCVSFYFGSTTTKYLISGSQSLSWESGEDRVAHRLISFPKLSGYAIVPLGDAPDEYTKWLWRGLGFGIGKIAFASGDNFSFWRVPYWSTVAPLTLLSACLLLSKPKQKPDK